MGGDLRSYIDDVQRQRVNYCLSDSEACLFSFQVFKALNYLHEHKIAHRDIKPENILLASHNVNTRLILADFGAAYISRDGSHPLLRRRMTFKGTSVYLAP